jgi:hypothetical protein
MAYIPHKYPKRYRVRRHGRRSHCDTLDNKRFNRLPIFCYSLGGVAVICTSWDGGVGGGPSEAVVAETREGSGEKER